MIFGNMNWVPKNRKINPGILNIVYNRFILIMFQNFLIRTSKNNLGRDLGGAFFGTPGPGFV
jgi:hypothetical protein